MDFDIISFKYSKYGGGVMEFFLKNRVVITRTLGALLLVVGFVSFFWATPKMGINENEIAAANIARLEARLAGSSTPAGTQKPDTSKILEKFKETREDQLRYLMILMMIAGVAFLLYSFFKKEKSL